MGSYIDFLRENATKPGPRRGPNDLPDDPVLRPSFSEKLRRAVTSIPQGASNAVASGMSAPVDLINWGLSKVGAGSDEPVGGSDWMRRQGLTAEPESGFWGGVGEVAGGVLPVVGQAKQAEIAKGLLRGGENLAKPRELPLEFGGIGWHASPNKFAALDIEKVGSGPTKMNKYGKGLYVAQNPAVSGPKGWYRDMFSESTGTLKFNNKEISGDALQLGRSPQDLAVRYMYYSKGNIPLAMEGFEVGVKEAQASLAEAEQALQRYATAPPEILQQVRDRVADVKNLIQEKTSAADWLANNAHKFDYTPGGYTYKVEYPDKDVNRMLSWDAPMARQGKTLVDVPVRQKDLLNVPAVKGGLGYANPGTGGDYYSRLSQYLGSQKAATEMLKNSGVPGIKYFDSYSRGQFPNTFPPITKDPTHNLVFFDDKNLQILERNEQAINTRELINELQKRARRRMGKDW